jgi:hypothetical protein
MFGVKKGEAAVLAKIAAMPAPHRDMAQRLHRTIVGSAPSLEPGVRWGLPMYKKAGKDVCYIKAADGYLAFGFSEENPATRQAGAPMHAVAWVLTSLDAATEARIAALVRDAAK